MKTTMRISAALGLILITVFAGCKKDKEVEYNRLVIAGNSNSSYNREIVPDECLIFPQEIIDCSPDMYRNNFRIGFETGEAMFIEINKTTSSSEIPVGSFPFSGQCLPGNISYLFLQDGRKSAGIYFSAGTITITIDGEVYDIDIDMTIDAITGGGTVKGNFHGLIQPGVTK